MVDQIKQRRMKRYPLKAALAISFTAIVISAALYLTGDSFKNTVRQKVVNELERTTGGTVTLKSFTWNLSQLEFVAEDLTIRGLEPPTEVPYAHIDYLKVRVKIFSIFDREIGLRYVGASRPVIHIIVNKDGSTNQPVPKIKRESGRSPIDLLFDLAIDRLEVAEGMLLLNQRKIPLDFTAEKVSTAVNYNAVRREYNGKVAIGSSNLRYAKFRPLPANAELQFDLRRDVLVIRSLRVATPGSQMEASGQVKNFNSPQLELTYRATLDLPELASSANIAEFRAGHAELQGTGSYGNTKYSSRGTATLKGIRWQSGGMSTGPVTAASRFELSNDQLRLENILAQIFGGAVRGIASISPLAGPMQHGHAELTLGNLQLSQMAGALSTRNLKLERIDPRGAVNGNVKLSWSGSPANTVAQLKLNVVAPTNIPATSLPVNGRLDGVLDLRTDSLQLATLRLATRSTQLNATGDLGSNSAQLRINLESTNLAEFSPLLPQDASMPVELEGSARFSGIVSGRFSAPTVKGRVEARNFTTMLPAKAGQQPRNVHWDAVAADVDYGPASTAVRNGVLQRGKAQVEFAGSATLEQGRFTEASGFDVTAGVANGDVADFQSIAGLNYPITGTIDVSIRAFGTKADLNGNANVRVTNGRAYDEPFKSLRADLRLARNEVHATNVALAQNGATVNGTGTYHLNSKRFRFDIRGQDFNLAHFEQLQKPRFSVTGKVRFNASGFGTLEQPNIEGDLYATQLIVNGEPLGDITAEARTVGRELRLNARATYEQASFVTTGTVQLQGDLPSRINLTFKSVDVDPGLRLVLGNRLTGHSALNGTVAISGPLKRWRSLTVEARLTDVNAEIEGVRLSNHDPIVARMVNGLVRLENFHLKGEGTNFQANGTAQLVPVGEVNLKADGNINLKLLQAINRDLLSYGNLVVALSVTGAVNKPNMQGQLRIQNAGVSFIDLPNGLSEIDGTLVFDQNRLRVQNLTGKTGGGTVEIGGFISYRRDLFFNLTATGKDVRFRYPPGISTSANLDLRFSGTTKDSLLSGDILVTRFNVNPRFDFALYLARSKQAATPTAANPVLSNLRLDVRAISTPELRVETSLAKLAGDADLRIRGTAANPAVLGRINIVEGDVFFNGTRYNLERGDVTFVNPARIEPVLNVEASARVREYDITLGFHGSVDKLSTSYRSEPPLPTADIIALLALGRTREESAMNQTVQTSFTETASNAILGQALDAAISSRVQKLFGVSRIKIDPEVGGPTGNPNARLTIEQQVNNNVTVTYITDLTRSNQQIVQGEFNLTRDVSLILVRDQYGVLGFDVRVRQRLK